MQYFTRWDFTLLKNHKKAYYCGPMYIPGSIKRLLSSRFNSQCKTHDESYDSMLNNRLSIDIKFLREMINNSSSTIDISIAVSFYYLVRCFGWISWLIIKLKRRVD